MKISIFVFEYPIFGRKYLNIRIYLNIRHTLPPTLTLLMDSPLSSWNLLLISWFTFVVLFCSKKVASVWTLPSLAILIHHKGRYPTFHSMVIFFLVLPGWLIFSNLKEFSLYPPFSIIYWCLSLAVLVSSSLTIECKVKGSFLFQVDVTLVPSGLSPWFSSWGLDSSSWCFPRFVVLALLSMVVVITKAGSTSTPSGWSSGSSWGLDTWMEDCFSLLKSASLSVSQASSSSSFLSLCFLSHN